MEGSAGVVAWNAILSIAQSVYPEHKTIVFAIIETLFAFGYMIGKKCFSQQDIKVAYHFNSIWYNPHANMNMI